MALQEKDIQTRLEKMAEAQGFSGCGAVTLERPLSFDLYKSWLEKNHFGEMTYLKSHLPQKENPQSFSPRLKSALVFSHSYYPEIEQTLNSEALGHTRRALYSKGKDYHLWLKEKLMSLINELQCEFPGEVFLAFTDSAPVLERDLAYRAGLGWFGKNSCLIHPKKGSFFFISEIYTSLDLNFEAATLPDFCGTCTRCIEICPTQAIADNRTLVADKCISYLTIESRQVPAENLRSQIGDWFFGCDLCQTVCPWNQKLFKNQLSVVAKQDLNQEALKEDLIKDLKWVLTTSGKQLQKALIGSPLLRAGPFGLRRNAIVVAANQNLKELLPEIAHWQKDEKLKSLVLWAEQVLKT